jgi:imidazolonepropionase-like amidohydrolase
MGLGEILSVSVTGQASSFANMSIHIKAPRKVAAHVFGRVLMRCDRVWINARLATMDPTRAGLGEIDRGVMAAVGGRIAYAGSVEAAPSFQATETIDCDGRWITPGLIDPHTHLVFAGDRAHEFELRLAGASYEEIARAGGGIISTMTATRAASEGQLIAAALPRLDALIAEGVTTVEIKSGYGLSLEHELKSPARRQGAWPNAAPSTCAPPCWAPTPCRRSSRVIPTDISATSANR